MRLFVATLAQESHCTVAHSPPPPPPPPPPLPFTLLPSPTLCLYDMLYVHTQWLTRVQQRGPAVSCCEDGTAHLNCSTVLVCTTLASTCGGFQLTSSWRERLNYLKWRTPSRPTDTQTYTQTQAHRQTNEQTNKQTNEQTHRQTHRQTNEQTYRHTDKERARMCKFGKGSISSTLMRTINFRRAVGCIFGELLNNSPLFPV